MASCACSSSRDAPSKRFASVGCRGSVRHSGDGAPRARPCGNGGPKLPRQLFGLRFLESGRERLPESLPRVEKVIRCEEQTCRACGQETSIIGYDESEQLDVEPARYFVQVVKREKRAGRGCEQSTVTMAPLPPRIVEKGLASDNVVIDAVISKYCDHLPLYRQALILEREGDNAVLRIKPLSGNGVSRVVDFLESPGKHRLHAQPRQRRFQLAKPTCCLCSPNAHFLH